jgi:alkylhydroperoxidase family enzyme
VSLHSTEPRIRPLEPPYEEDVAAMLARWMPPGAGAEPLGLFRTLMRHPELGSRMRPLGAAILSRHALVEPRLRELMILRTCALCANEYEWGVHAAAFGAAVGLVEGQLAATAGADAGAPDWSEREAAVLRLAQELHETGTVSAELWDELESLLGEREIIELIVTAGWYHTISYLCNALAIEREPWAARFPAGAR